MHRFTLNHLVDNSITLFVHYSEHFLLNPGVCKNKVYQMKKNLHNLAIFNVLKILLEECLKAYKILTVFRE